MDHRTIDEQNVAEAYVTGRLSPADAAVFEEHFLDCPECCARVEAAQRLERGLRSLAEAAAAGAFETSRERPWRHRALAAAAVLLLALLPASFAWWQLREVRGELGAAREELTRAVEPERFAALERALADEAERRQSLANELEASRGPRVVSFVVALTATRGSLEGPLRTVRLPPRPGWMALWIEPGDSGFPTYAVKIVDAKGAVVFEASDLALNDLGALLVTLDAAALDPGTYGLDVAGLASSGAMVPVNRFPLRIEGGG